MRVCAATSATKTTAVATTFSTSAVRTSSTTSAVRTSSMTSTCASSTAVAVTFEDEVTTIWGETIKIVGSVSQLGSWNVSSAIALSAEDYTECDRYWYAKCNGCKRRVDY